MTDSAFQKLLDRTANAHRKYTALLELAEQEYERRFGDNPSNRDDDFWIDTLHGAGGPATNVTVAQVTDSALLRQ